MSYQDPYAPQDVYAQQQQLGKGESSNPPPYTQPDAYAQPAQQPYAQPGAYPPQQQYAQPGAYPQQQYAQPGAYPQQQYAQPGAYPPPQQYGQPGAYQQPQPNYVRAATRGGNPWANGALYSGIISLVFALITFVSQIGYAGLITGSFAIYRGIVALNRSKNLPGNPGRTQAILAIVMGVAALLLVFASFAIRGVAGS
jgi:hypothetical protein